MVAAKRERGNAPAAAISAQPGLSGDAVLDTVTHTTSPTRLISAHQLMISSLALTSLSSNHAMAHINKVIAMNFEASTNSATVSSFLKSHGVV